MKEVYSYGDTRFLGLLRISAVLNSMALLKGMKPFFCTQKKEVGVFKGVNLVSVLGKLQKLSLMTNMLQFLSQPTVTKSQL